MKTNTKALSAELGKKNIRPSFQRIKVLEYLIKNQFHPTAEEIYAGLQGEIPTLSKSTIYNTLNTFMEAGLVKVLNIEDNETRYDIITESHGHFKCEKCRVIFNFNINIDTFTTEALNGFLIIDRDVYFKGICPKCLLNINQNEKNRKENVL